MSVQFNFYAMMRDEELIAGEVLTVFGELYSLPDRAPLVEMVPANIQKPSDLFSNTIDGMCYLFREDDIHHVVMESAPNDLFYIPCRAFACLEYEPSRFTEAGALQIGRFAYFYTEDADFKRMVQTLFRRLRKHARKVPKTASYWIFDEAARNAPELKGW